MVKDKNGKELNVGDEVIIRGKVAGFPIDHKIAGKSLLQVDWASGSPFIAFIDSEVVEKAE